MDYYFWKDGTYSKENNLTKEMEFKVIDISTQRKGPIVTFTKNNNENFEKIQPVRIRMEMTYDIPDVPFDAQNAFEQCIELNYANCVYNIYPLIKQMISYNDFINVQSPFIDNHIYFDKLILESEKENFIITEENSDKDISDIFDYLGIKTHMSEIIKSGYCIVMSNRGYWKSIYLENDNYIDYMNWGKWNNILICFPEMETAYNIQYNTLLEMERIKELSIKVIYTPILDKYSLSYLEDLESPCENEYSAISVTDILRVCIFVPQIIYINQILYNMDATIEINIVRDNQNIRLTITEKESKYDINTCIYNLIEHLLRINMEEKYVKKR